MELNRVIAEVKKGAGTQFDPFITKIVLQHWDVLINQLHQGNLNEIGERINVFKEELRQ